MRPVLFTVILTFSLFIGGCAELYSQLDDPGSMPNQIAGTAETVGQGITAVQQSPAGAFIPEPYKTIASITGFSLLTLVAAYKTWKKRVLEQTTRAIVAGVENNDSGATKDDISDAMRLAGIEASGRQIVKQIKATL